MVSSMAKANINKSQTTKNMMVCGSKMKLRARVSRKSIMVRSRSVAFLRTVSSKVKVSKSGVINPAFSFIEVT